MQFPDEEQEYTSFFYASLKYNWEHQLATRLESSLKLKRKRDERDL